MTEKAIEAVNEASDGDLRKTITILQSCASLNKNIDEKSVYEIASLAEPKEIIQVITLSINGRFIEAKEKLLDTMLQHGLSGLDTIKQIQKKILNLEIDEKKKAKLIEKCGEVEFRLVEGSDEYLQLEALLASFSLI